VTVIDASAVVDLLVPSDPARRASLLGELPEPGAPWLAPDVLPYEVFAVIRRQLQRGTLSHTRASRALDRLNRLPLDLVPTLALLRAAWALRERCSAADSLYAALALRAAEPLVTTDMRLAKTARKAGITVRIP
jgi:predicted nucleic acid-binding protein